jgi:hypothetical protein
MIALILLLATSALAQPCFVAARRGCAIKPHSFVAGAVRPNVSAQTVLLPDNSVTFTTESGHVFFVRCLGAGAGRPFLHPGLKSQLIWSIGREKKVGPTDIADRGRDGYHLLAECQRDTDALKAAVAAGQKVTIAVDESGLKVTGESGGVFLGARAGSALQMQNENFAP